jgi:hypothetical protein
MTPKYDFGGGVHSILPPARHPEYDKDPDYQKIMDIVEGLWLGRVIERGAGYCLSMSDLIHTVLREQAGIDSQVVECKLTVLTNNPPSLKLIGHEGLKTGNNIDALDTHVVCITNTTTPYLIDLSVSNILSTVSYVVEPLTSTTNTMLDLSTGGSKWIYQQRENHKLPEIYQSNMLNRYRTDRKIFNSIRWLKILIVVVITISTVNAVRGAYDFYQVYIDDQNYWGPQHIKELHDKVRHLEELIKLPQDQR